MSPQSALISNSSLVFFRERKGGIDSGVVLAEGDPRAAAAAAAEEEEEEEEEGRALVFNCGVGGGAGF